MTQRAAGGQELDLWPIGDQPLHIVQHLDQVCSVGTDQRYPEAGPTVQIEMINFGHADHELATNVSYQRPDNRTLFLDRPHFPKPQVEFDSTHPHCHSAERTDVESPSSLKRVLPSPVLSTANMCDICKPA